MLLGVKQVHQKLNGVFGINAVRDMMASGRIPSEKICNKYLTTEKDVDDFVKKIHMESHARTERLKRLTRVR